MISCPPADRADGADPQQEGDRLTEMGLVGPVRVPSSSLPTWTMADCLLAQSESSRRARAVGMWAGESR